MNSEQEIILIEPDMLKEKAALLKIEHWRLVQICAINEEEQIGYQLTYSFAKNNSLRHLRLNVSQDTQIESITRMFSYAFLYENEIKELFGVDIVNIALDFNGHLYKTAVKTPFLKGAE